MNSTTFALAVIIASVREGRFGPVVADWFVGQAKQRDDVNVDVIDLADTPSPSANFASRIGAADAFVVVTPEYNHGYPGPLKTAIDSVGRETVSFHGAHAQFDEHGAPREPAAVNTAAGVLLDQLAWWAHPLVRARAAHPYGT
ncbi:MAG: NADPH-dependent FMN reductase [Pseudonocardiales bacterium]|nr:NAD(P)H-dependent oxidoreductase [Pseudonocardiales bacterium]PZS35750.1 MAG: NADPH-dependent FMN reductase [Pseudonocardiales bacterium]